MVEAPANKRGPGLLRRVAGAAVAVTTLLVTLPCLVLGQSHEAWSYNQSMYEVNIRQYTPEGTFAAFETHLDRLDSMGLGILWLMPVHPIGEENRLGSLGSYYSVRNYREVDPAYGTIEDLRSLVQAAHDRGMYIILDWVANHTSWDNVLTTEHPEWYIRNAGQFIPPPGTNWSDVIELDYSKQGLRDYMIESMIFWVDEVGIDGFRFDAVSFVPTDFWSEVSTALLAAHPDLLLLAENDGREWHNAGLHMSFGWGLYGFGSGVLPRVVAGTNTAGHIAAYVANEFSTYGDGAYRLYFTSNHDENSWHGTPTELFGDAQKVFAVLTATFGGMPLIYSGQEAGLNKRLAFFDKDLIPWRDDPYRELYTKLVWLKRTNSALWNGTAGGVPQRVTTSNNAAVYAFVREEGTGKVFVALNVSAHAQNVTLNGSAFADNYRNVFTGEPVTLEPGASVELPAWGYAVYARGDVDTGLEDSVRDRSGIPKEGGFLGESYPNPFSANTRITYSLRESGDVRLALFDALGRQVRVVLDGSGVAGSHEVEVAAGNLPSGVYYVRLLTGGRVTTRSVVILR